MTPGRKLKMASQNSSYQGKTTKLQNELEMYGQQEGSLSTRENFKFKVFQTCSCELKKLYMIPKKRLLRRNQKCCPLLSKHQKLNVMLNLRPKKRAQRQTRVNFKQVYIKRFIVTIVFNENDKKIPCVDYMREYQSHRFLVEFEQLLIFLLERKYNVTIFGVFNSDTLVDSFILLIKVDTKFY